MRESEKWKWSRSVVSNSLWPHGLQPTRLLRPSDSPAKSTGVGCHCLLQFRGLHSRKEDVDFLRESKKASVRRKCFNWASGIKRKFPSAERVEWNTKLMEVHTREQGAVKTYSVFKDYKRPLVEYDVGMKLTSHWSLQNIRVSSKNISKSIHQGPVCVSGTTRSAAFPEWSKIAFAPCEACFQCSGTGVRGAPCSRGWSALLEKMKPKLMSRRKVWSSVS